MFGRQQFGFDALVVKRILLRRRKLSQALLHHVHSTIQFSVGDNQWWAETQGVHASGDQQHTVVGTVLLHRGRRLGHLHAYEQCRVDGVADAGHEGRELRLQRMAALDEVFALGANGGQEFLVVDFVHHDLRNPAVPIDSTYNGCVSMENLTAWRHVMELHFECGVKTLDREAYGTTAAAHNRKQMSENKEWKSRKWGYAGRGVIVRTFAAAQTKGFPPKVVPWSPGMIELANFSLISTAPIGSPPDESVIHNSTNTEAVSALTRVR